MKRRGEAAESQGYLERGLRWDIGFNRKLGTLSLVAAGGIAVAGSPIVGAKLALFAGANFAVAELEARAARSLAKH